MSVLDTLNVQRVAVGVSSNSSLNALDLIDNTGGAQQVTTSDELTGALLGNPITGATLTDFDLLVSDDGGTTFVNVNGNYTITGAGDLDNNGSIDINDLTSTGLGFNLGLIELGDLDPTVDNTIRAIAAFDDGTVLAVDNIIQGVLPV